MNFSARLALALSPLAPRRGENGYHHRVTTPVGDLDVIPLTLKEAVLARFAEPERVREVLADGPNNDVPLGKWGFYGPDALENFAAALGRLVGQVLPVEATDKPKRRRVLPASLPVPANQREFAF